MKKNDMKYGFKEVSPDDGAVLVWAEPRSIALNEDNPIDHTVEQTEAVQESIGKHGWIIPLVYNLTTGHLIDGHDRLGIAISRGHQAVPVWVGAWPKEDEPEIIILLRETGQMAKWNPDRSAALLARLEQSSGSAKKIIDQMVKREGLMEKIEQLAEKVGPLSSKTDPAPLDWVVDKEPDPGLAERMMGKSPAGLSAARVRLVQLFIDQNDVEKFNDWVEDLQEMWGVESVTEAVMRTLSDAHLAYLRGGRRSRS